STTEFVRTLTNAEPAASRSPETSQTSQFELAEPAAETEVETERFDETDTPRRESPVRLDDLPPLPPIPVEGEVDPADTEPEGERIDASAEPDADGFLPLKDEAA
ncbi:MAG: hypothetical protein AAGK78_09765, partial [Planctomycetota bacterium]